MSTQRGPDAPESKRYRWYALGVLVLVFTSSHVDRQIMGILLEPIKQELGASDTQMGFLVGITFAIFYATLGVPIAMMGVAFSLIDSASASIVSSRRSSPSRQARRRS